MKKIAFIPARGGSKSVPKKNIAPFRGHPLISWTLFAAKNSGLFDEIVVSTDCAEIGKVSSGILNTLIVDPRPESLAGDEASVTDVVHEFLSRRGERDGLLYLLQPTSPFLTPETIRSSHECFIKYDSLKSLQTITPVEHNKHAWNQRHLSATNEVSFVFEEERKRAYNKQKKPKLYLFGNLIVVKISDFLKSKNLFQKPSMGLIVSEIESFDVDTKRDFIVGEMLHKLYQEGKL